ncbi:MAG: hypothetical protein IPP37_04950 [Saprospiraceae bacterium]|nr:hypothetical protein [Saprospiraceae bacterium]
MNLEPGSADGGDNIYTACGVVGNGPGSQPGQGLYNKAEWIEQEMVLLILQMMLVEIFHM